MLVLTAVSSLLLPLVRPAPSEGCGKPLDLDYLQPGRDTRLSVTVSEPGMADIKR